MIQMFTTIMEAFKHMLSLDLRVSCCKLTGCRNSHQQEKNLKLNKNPGSIFAQWRNATVYFSLVL